ncbi:DNA-binding protein [Clostridium sp. C8-1-8]|uniref:ribbon-helix-helix domain-containing protein n=1 Tax=Clostridium sp. C8-1-8 TaxID=2698831 RepID=UPI00136BE23B|nr:DNA-binding protein [Clostridium sp. C8-1-8]
MPIGEDKTRILVTVTKELKEKLEKQAKKENRTVANLLNTIAIKYLEEQQRRLGD